MKSWSLESKILAGEVIAILVVALATAVGVMGVNWMARREGARLTALMETRPVDVVALADALMGRVAATEPPSVPGLALK
ncbi:MAG TPA: hypothetical protein VF678_15725 [bacterium]